MHEFFSVNIAGYTSHDYCLGNPKLSASKPLQIAQGVKSGWGIFHVLAFQNIHVPMHMEKQPHIM